MKIIKCYICNSIMKYIETSEVKILGGKCETYECPKCGEKIYSPLRKFKEFHN